MGTVDHLQATDPVSLWEELREAGAVTETELRLPPDLNFSHYEALAIMFGRIKRTTSWLIGDLILYGESAYGEKYAQAISMTGLAPSTLSNYASICKHIPPSRRRPGISFSLHQEVAYLDPDAQSHWLDMAEREDWTKEMLRLAIRSATSDPVGDLADNEQDRRDSMALREEHPSGVPAADGGFLGELVPGPITCPSCGHRFEES